MFPQKQLKSENVTVMYDSSLGQKNIQTISNLGRKLLRPKKKNKKPYPLPDPRIMRFYLSEEGANFGSSNVAMVPIPEYFLEPSDDESDSARLQPKVHGNDYQTSQVAQSRTNSFRGTTFDKSTGLTPVSRLNANWCIFD